MIWRQPVQGGLGPEVLAVAAGPGYPLTSVPAGTSWPIPGLRADPDAVADA